VVVGRILEFGQPLDSQIAVWPAGSRFQGQSSRGAGLTYRTRYGFAGATAANDSDMLLEGLDGIDLTLKSRAEIDAFVERDRRERPWIHLGAGRT